MTVRAIGTILLAAALAGCTDFGDDSSAAFRAADAVVVYSDVRVKTEKGRQCMREGAEDLAKALSKTTGRTIRCYREGEEPKGGSPIYLGDTDAARAAGLDASALPALGYRIKAEKGRAFILAKTGTGAGYGVTGFVESNFPYRFLTVSGDDPYEVVPNATVAVCDRTERPAIYYRQLYTSRVPEKMHPRWKDNWLRFAIRRRYYAVPEEIEAKDRLSTRVPHCHSMYKYVPPEKYFKDHPEYYSMNGKGVRVGVRNHGSQLCMTNPDVKDIVVREMLGHIAKDRADSPTDYPLIYDFTQMDSSPALCRCPECRKVADRYCREPGRYPTGGDAGLLLEFVNDITRRVRAKYPDVYVRTFAYVSTETPPKGGIVPDDHVIIWLCDLYSTSDHELPLAHPYNAKRRELVTGWGAIAKRLELWDYMLYGDCRDGGGTGGDFPEVNVDAIAADAKLFRDCGVARMFMESEFHEQPFYWLHAYVMSECWWNPDCDLEKLVSDYCAVYGRAAAKMREAVGLLRSFAATQPPTAPNQWWKRDLPWITVANLERIRALFDEAYALEPAGEARARIALAQASVNRKLAAMYGNAGAAEKRADAFRRAYAAAKEGYLVDFPADGRGWKAADLVLSSKFSEIRFKDLPAELRDVPDGELFCLDSTFEIRSPPCVYFDDAKSERGRCMRVWERDGAGKVCPRLPIVCTLTGQHEKAKAFSFSPVKDETYRWYHLGEGHFGKSAALRLPKSGVMYFNLSDVYQNADGMATDPNNGDIWISARYSDALYVDRVAVRRLPKAADAPPASGGSVRIESEGGRFRAYREGERTAFAEWRRPEGRFAMDVKTVAGRPFAFVTVRPENGTAPWKPGMASLPAITVSGFNVEPVAMTSGGLRRLDANAPSCGYLALAEPMTRRGVVVAWLTNLKASGALAFGRESGGIRVTPIVDYGPMTVFPDRPQDADTFVIGAFDDCRIGLEAYADAVAERFAIKLPPNRSGYCSWCSDRYGYSDRSEFARGCGAGSEASSCEYAAVAARLLKPYGFDFIQFDDQWQNGEEINGPARDYTRTHPKGGYPDGFAKTVGCINANGFAAGLWFIPFGGCAREPAWAGKDGLYVKSRVAVEREIRPVGDVGPRVLPRKKGDSLKTVWGGECLDLTNPDARAELAANVRRFTCDWGFRYLKCDGIYAGLGCDLCHGGCWCDANFGNAEFRDQSASNVSAYRKGFETIRKAAAPGTFLLGCNLASIRALVPSFGLVDGMRAGGDNGPIDMFPERYMKGVVAGSMRYFLNGRVWWSDPDSTYVRAATPLGRARSQATWTALTDSLFEVGDWLPGMPDERVEILRRTLAHHRIPNVRPIDYFEHDIPNAWIVDGGSRKVVGLFNWSTNEVLRVDYDAAYAGLDAGKTYVGYDFWGKRPFGPFKGRLTVDVPVDDCLVLQVAEMPEGGGEVLVSASSHVAAPLFLPPEVPGDPVEYRYYSRARGFDVVRRKK